MVASALVSVLLGARARPDSSGRVAARAVGTTGGTIPLSKETAQAVGSVRAARMIETEQQKHLVLILAREFASNLSTPTLIADAQGRLVFYNEAAEAVVGTRFSEAGEMPLDEWIATFEPRSETTSAPLPPERRPARIAFDERRASHMRYLVTSVDGVEREIEVTAFPLFAHTDEFVGIVAIFWRA